jgi:hypothetical protein
MDERQLQERGNRLEEEFFQKQNAAVLAKMRESKADADEHSAMSAALGADDPALIELLREHGVTSITLAAVSLAPLVLVAWADRTLEDKERSAVLKEASASGLVPGSPEMELVESWLRERPPGTLLETWAAYAKGVAEALDDGRRAEFRESIISRAKAVAGAAGGFAGMNRVSAAEKEVLDQVEAALA